jgi:hypothetical protein
MSSLAMAGILGVGILGTDLGAGTIGAGTTAGTIGAGIIGAGIPGIVLGVGIMGGTIGVGTHGMAVLIWAGAIISTTVMYIMATTGIIMDGIMVKIIETGFMVVVKVAH